MPSNDYYTVSVRVQQSERLACKRAAEITGMTVSAWSRQKLLAALRPDDYVEQVDEQPEDAAQEGDADVVGVEGFVPQKDATGVPQEDARQNVDLERPDDPVDTDRPDGDRSQQPLTYRKTDLCSRCQRIGPSCATCRTLIRGRRLV